MTSERDELAEVIWDEAACDWRQDGPNETADAILAAGYRKKPESGAEQVRSAVEAALKLISPDDITPVGARIIQQAMAQR